MAAIAILDLLRKNPNFGGQTFISRGLFSSKLAGASSFAFATPFAFGFLFRNGGTQVAYCDAGAALSEDHFTSDFGASLGADYATSIRAASGNLFQSDALRYSTKQYDIQLKPLLSAFHWKTLGLTSLRSFLLFYLPLLEPHADLEDEDDDFLKEDSEGKPLDLVVPFKKSVKQIVRETTVVTTRRVLERLAVHYVSQRMAWKLLKDVPKSAARKAGRGMPYSTYCFCVSRTTFRGHLLGFLASLIVQVGVDVYRFFNSIFKAKEDDGTVDTQNLAWILGKKVYGAFVRCGASLIFASIGAGIGAALVRPATGQWIGCALGDLAGPVIVVFCFEKLNLPL